MRNLGRRLFGELWPRDAVEWALGLALFAVVAFCVISAASEIFALARAGGAA